MTTKKRLFLILIVLLIPAIIYIFTLNTIPASTHTEKTVLEKVGDECAGIAENSVANMTAIVEFQKLEIQGRKFNVMRRCMADHAYFENPKWTAYAKPLAQSNSINEKISEDEAIENLRRNHMLVFKERPGQPIYWEYRP
jgi:hypothetical protein